MIKGLCRKHLTSPEMKTEKKNTQLASSVIVAVVSAVCHGVAFFEFQVRLGGLNLPSFYPADFYFLVILSFSLSLLNSILFLTQQLKVALYFNYSIRFGILILIGLPMGDNLGIEFSLLMPLLFEGTMFFAFPLSIALSSGLLLATLLLQQPVKAWNTLYPRAAYYEIMFYGTCSVLLVFTLNCLRFFEQRYRERASIVEYLSGVNTKLASANIDFQNYAASIEAMSTVNERNRLTREIHDTVGYAMTNLIMMMEAASDIEKPHDLRILLERAKGQAQEVLSDTRRILRELRAVEENRNGGIWAVNKLIKTFARVTNVQVILELGDIPWSFGEEIDLAVFRLIQEGLTNAFKHGKATQIKVQFWRDHPRIGVNIQDNGSGCKEIKEGIGMSGMRERIEELGGLIRAGNSVDGFQLSAWFPWTGDRL